MKHAFETRAVGVAALAALMLAAGCGGGMSAGETAGTLKNYCSECHNDVDFAGDLDFATLDAAHVEANPAAWEAVVRKLRTRMMPPQDARRPDAETYDRLAASLERALDAAATPNPGRPALRRLNRAEYANAIRDL